MTSACSTQIQMGDTEYQNTKRKHWCDQRVRQHQWGVNQLIMQDNLLLSKLVPHNQQFDL